MSKYIHMPYLNLIWQAIRGDAVQKRVTMIILTMEEHAIPMYPFITELNMFNAGDTVNNLLF